MNTPKSSHNTTPTAENRNCVRRRLEFPHIPFETDTFEETDEEEPVPELRTDVCDDWPIRNGYLTYSLEDIARENCEETLNCWLRLYTPSAQPQSDEEHFYVYQMASAINAKLFNLKNKCT